jgi:hypothetical protein
MPCARSEDMESESVGATGPEPDKDDGYTKHNKRKALLSALSRKSNEILKLLPNYKYNLGEIENNYKEYLLRESNLYTACDDEISKTWLLTHISEIELFRNRVQNLLKPEETGARPKTPGSVASYASNLSEARVELARQKAQAIARKQSKGKQLKLEEMEIKLKREFEQQMRKLKLEQQNIKDTEEDTKISVFESELLKIEKTLLDDRNSCIGNPDYVSQEVFQTCGPLTDLHTDPIIQPTELQLTVETNNPPSLTTILQQQNEISRHLLQSQDKSTLDRKSTRLNSSHVSESRMPSSA